MQQIGSLDVVEVEVIVLKSIFGHSFRDQNGPSFGQFNAVPSLLTCWLSVTDKSCSKLVGL